MALKTLQAGASSSTAAGGGGGWGGAQGVPAAARAITGQASDASGGVLGTAQSPVYTQHLEPTFWAQAWRTIRTLGVAFVVISGVGALVGDAGPGGGGGISRGLLGGDAVKPSTECGTTFADVKGVDEAKGELVEIVEARSISHWFPYDRVGVVNADP